MRRFNYPGLLRGIVQDLEQAHRASARSVNTLMTTTYWLVGRRIVEFEQEGRSRAAYGASLLERLAKDLNRHFARGFSRRNLQQMRLFYEAWPKWQTLSAKSAGNGSPDEAAIRFSLPWSHYVRLLSVENSLARQFYESEALRGGWSVRQLDRQIGTQFYERTALSKDKKAMLIKGSRPLPGEAPTPEGEFRDPFVLEFLGLKDEYSENDLEEALVRHLEVFLLELGGDFAFVGRQRRLRVGDEWYRVDLLFYHRGLRCLVVIDLKTDKFTHADAGQMHLYLNCAKEHWTKPGENPPVGVILCTRKDDAVAHYALGGLTNKVLAAEYKTKLPREREWTEQILKARAGIALALRRRN